MEREQNSELVPALNQLSEVVQAVKGSPQRAENVTWAHVQVVCIIRNYIVNNLTFVLGQENGQCSAGIFYLCFFAIGQASSEKNLF